MFWISYAAAPISGNLIWSGGAWPGVVMASIGLGAAAVLVGLVLGARQSRASRAPATARWPEAGSKLRRAAA